jgi:hypothetical protein
MPTTSGNFALSLRGETQSCAVYARTADPEEVEANFKQIVEGVRRPGIEVSIVGDTTEDTPSGKAHSLAYAVRPPQSEIGFSFVMLTVDRPGGPFQASIIAGLGRQPPTIAPHP